MRDVGVAVLNVGGLKKNRYFVHVRLYPAKTTSRSRIFAIYIRARAQARQRPRLLRINDSQVST